jgi:hypothetical protein
VFLCEIENIPKKAEREMNIEIIRSRLDGWYMSVCVGVLWTSLGSYLARAGWSGEVEERMGTVRRGGRRNYSCGLR